MPVHAQGIGDLFVPVAVASGEHVKLAGRAEAVTFIVYAAAGDQGVTLRESINGTGEQTLAVIDTIYECPGAGGTWGEITQAAAATYTHSDATNDMIAFTVYGDQLSDGFDSLEVTTTGTSPVTLALVHGLNYKRTPANLPSFVV